MDVQERSVHGFNLTKQDLEHLSRVETSIREHSTKYAQAMIEARGLEGQVADLYEARRQFILKKAEESGIDPKSIQGVQVDKDGAVSVLVIGPAGAQDTGPSDSPSGDPEAS
jgi:hypothetical protein